MLSGQDAILEISIQPNTDCCKVSQHSYIFTVENETYFLKFQNEEGKFLSALHSSFFNGVFLDVRNFNIAVTKIKSGKGASVFSVRTEDSSATQYFQFYGYLSQQQNMLQDFVRTYTYQRAILNNLQDFKDKIVLDVGAGSGILSFFAVQAGAKHVFAVEASTMAHYAQVIKIILHNNNFYFICIFKRLVNKTKRKH